MVAEENAAGRNMPAGRAAARRKTAQKSAKNGRVEGLAHAEAPSSNYGAKVPYEEVPSACLSPRPEVLKQHGGRLGRVLDMAVKEPQTGATLAASCDWISCTLPELPGWQDVVDHLVRGVADVRESWRDNDRGRLGYERSANIGQVVVAWGGSSQRQTVYLSIPGAVSGALDRQKLIQVADILEHSGARLTRVDAAVDDFDGAFLDVEQVRKWYADGLFVSDGRPPKAKFISDEGNGTGSTFYVGARASGKILRVYEKGKQLGNPTSKWVRAEVQMGNKHRALPFEALYRPADVIAGAYPALSPVSRAPLAISGYYVKLSMSIDRAVEIAKTQCGAVVNLLTLIDEAGYKDNAERIIDRLIRHGQLPKRIDYSSVKWKKDRDYEQAILSS